MMGRVVCRGFPRWGARLAEWRADRSGSAAVEFALIALPFLMLLFGTISIAIYYFTTFTVENAVWMASRAIRTGQFQQGQGAYAGYTTNEDRKKAFKKALCDKAPVYLDCNRAVVQVQSNSGFGSIAPPACAKDGTLVDQASAQFDPGNADSVVLITVCYPWSFGTKLPFLPLEATLSDGSLLIQASVAFRSEPYPSN
jgi:Flp pilus assembly protein TadG